MQVKRPTKEAVDNCAHSVTGQNVLHDIGIETKNLKPSLNFVPWILINGVRNKKSIASQNILISFASNIL